jgi:hypothetical protein
MLLLFFTTVLLLAIGSVMYLLAMLIRWIHEFSEN